MSPRRVDLTVDIVYGVVISAAVVLILVIGWKMGRFDSDWMTREVAERVEETVTEEVEATVGNTVSEKVETTCLHRNPVNICVALSTRTRTPVPPVH